jgi:uncharacterized iron-regulated protein
MPLAWAAANESEPQQIWDTREKRFLTEDELYLNLARFDYVLLGERHDNPHHHLLQAAVIRALAKRRGMVPKRAVAFEMLRAEKQPLIDAHFRTHPGDVTGFAEAVSWAAAGWPDFAMYAPVVSAAVATGAPVVAADIPSTWLERARKEGLQALPQNWLADTGLHHPAPATVESALRKDIIEGHCGMVPEKHFERMIDIQRLRDAHLAWRLAQIESAVLIAGAGHVRRDVAVPLYLERLTPKKTVASVAFVEGRSVAGLPPDAGRYDFLWFTPVTERGDPCAELKERFKRPPEKPAASPAPRGTSGTGVTSPTRPLPSRSTPETQR